MKRLLYITHRVPYPPDKGDRIRTYHMLRSLAEQYQVDLLALADEPVSPETKSVLEKLCGKFACFPTHHTTRTLRMAWSILSGRSASLAAFRVPALAETVKTWLSDYTYDLLLASSSSVAPYLEPYAADMPLLIDLVDVDSEKWLNYAANAPFHQRWIYQREAKALRQYETVISRKARATLLVSDAETELFQKIVPVAKAYTVTNGVDLDYFQATTPVGQAAHCVFVGALDYFPNVDAVCWFAVEVWPRVLQQVPEALFMMVGRKPVAAVEALASRPGIRLVGQVPDVRPFVEAARVVVAPLRIARGLQNKVLEAMAMSRPVVASAPALAGLSQRYPSPACRVETIDAWVHQLAELLNQPSLAQTLGQQGRHYVEQHYAWSACLEPLHQLLNNLTTMASKQPSREPLALARH